MKTLLCCLVLVMMQALVATAQDAVREQLRLASTYERTGDMRSAARIYLEILDARPADNAAFAGVVRTLTSLGQFASLLPVLEQRDASQPTFELSLQLAVTYWKLGRQQDASTAWNTAIKRGGDDADAWAMVAESQAQVLATQLAIQSYRTARERGEDPTAHAAPLSALYIASGEIRQGAVEVLVEFDQSNDVYRAQGRLGAVMSTREGISVVGELLAANRDPEGSDRSRLRQWYFRETKNWKAALDETVEIDRKSNAKGQELMNFADGARRDGAYDVAIEAYDRVLAGSPTEQKRLTAVYSYARTLDAKLRAGTSFDKGDAKRIIDRYAGIVRDVPTHWYASSALYQMALLELDVLGNVDAGRDHLQRLVSQYAGTTAAADGALRLAKEYMLMDRFDAAETILANLGRTSNSETQPQRDMAMVMRGDLAVWRNRTDTAQQYYAAVAAIPGSPAANDALDRLLLLQLAEQDSAAVAMMHRADRASATGKMANAAAVYSEAASKARDAELRDRCRLAAAQAYVALRNDTAASAMLDMLIADVPETIFGDKALWTKAVIASRNNDVPSAVDALTTLLVQYPKSILLPTARERLRALRGDN